MLLFNSMFLYIFSVCSMTFYGDLHESRTDKAASNSTDKSTRSTHGEEHTTQFTGKTTHYANGVTNGNYSVEKISSVTHGKLYVSNVTTRNISNGNYFSEQNDQTTERNKWITSDVTSTKNSLQSKTTPNTSSILDVTGKQMLTGSYHTELATQSSTQHYLTELATQSPTGHYRTELATQSPTGHYLTELATQSSTRHYLTELATQSSTTHYHSELATQSWTIRNYNISETTGPYYRTVLAEQDKCALFGTCDFVSKLPTEYQFCHCDYVCNFYDDCCHDYLNYLSKHRSYSDMLSCAPVERIENVWLKLGIFLMDTCPELYTNSEIYEKCQQNDNVTKLYVADDKGTVYKNVYCAECHNVTNYRIFKIQISDMRGEYLSSKYTNMTFTEYLTVLLSDPNVKYKLIAPEGIMTRTCAMYQDPHINDTQECIAYSINPIATLGKNSNKIYRNQFCRRMENKPTGCFGAFPPRSPKQSGFSLSVLFSFSKKNRGTCGNGETKIDNICQKSRKYANTKVGMKYLLDLTPADLTPVDLAPTVDGISIEQILLSFVSSISVYDRVEVFYCRCLKSSLNSTNNSFLIELLLNLPEPMFNSELTKFRTKMQKFTWKSDIFLETSGLFLQLQTKELNTESNIYNYIVFSYSNNPGRKDLFYQLLASKLAQGQVQRNDIRNSSVCFDIYVNSVVVNQTLNIQNIKCMDKKQSRQASLGSDIFKPIVTYVGCSVSTLALIVSISVSRKLHMCRSVPGNNLENLSIGLVLSNLLFMIGIGANDYQIVCYVVGIILHYLWLASFSFMSIAVTYMCNNLTQLVLIASHGRKYISRTKKCLTLLGIVIPIPFVLLSVLLDFYKVPGFAAMYAGTICFPTGYLINAIFVSGPISLSIVINLISLIIIIIYIKSHSLTMNNMKKSHSIQEGKVYLRICAIAGLSWVTGIIGAVFQSNVLDYIFIVFCSFQGLTVAVANLTTAPVCRVIRKTLASKSSNATEETQ